MRTAQRQRSCSSQIVLPQCSDFYVFSRYSLPCHIPLPQIPAFLFPLSSPLLLPFFFCFFCLLVCYKSVTTQQMGDVMCSQTDTVPLHTLLASHTAATITHASTQLLNSSASKHSQSRCHAGCLLLCRLPGRPLLHQGSLLHPPLVWLRGGEAHRKVV